MSDKPKHLDPIPDDFASYDEAAKFWDVHDTADYWDEFVTVGVDAKLEARRFEVQLDEDIVKVLSTRAHERGIAMGRLVNEILRNDPSLRSG